MSSQSRSLLDLIPPGYKVIDIPRFEKSAQFSLMAGLCPDPEAWARKFERCPHVVEQWGLAKKEDDAA